MKIKNYFFILFLVSIFQLKTAEILYDKISIDFKSATDCDDCNQKLSKNSNIEISLICAQGIYFIDLIFKNSLNASEIKKLLKDNNIKWISFSYIDDLGKYDFPKIQNDENLEKTE